MRILFVTLAWPKTAEHNLYSDLMQEFVVHKHKVTVVTLNETKKQPLEELSIEDGIKVLRVITGKIQKTGKYTKVISTILAGPKMIYAINRYLRKEEYDLILFSTPSILLTPFVILLKRRYHAKLYLLLKDIWPQVAVDHGEMKKKGLTWRIFKFLEKLTYTHSDYIGCMSPANVKYLQKHNRYLKDKIIEICPNSQRNRKVQSIEKADLRKQYGLPEDKVIFVYGGNLGKAQGVEFIREVLQTYQEDDRVCFLILGDGTEYCYLEQEIQKMKSSNVKLLPSIPVEEYEKLLPVCDVGLIFLSNRNTLPNFPSRLLSYLNAKLPVLAACDRATDIGRIIEAAGCGKKTRSGDINSFQKAMEAFLSSEEARRKMGEYGYQLFLHRYIVEKSYEVIIKHFEWKVSPRYRSQGRYNGVLEINDSEEQKVYSNRYITIEINKVEMEEDCSLDLMAGQIADEEENMI